MTRLLRFAAVFLLAGVSACVAPRRHAEDIARDAGFAREVVRGAAYDHVIYRNGVDPHGRALHVYLEGDGRPYLDRWTVSPDPTPRHPLMLELMATDPAPAVYVGRPCYFGLARQPPCTPYDWTLRRYGPQVVESLARVIESLSVGSSGVELYGHSGGGALAVLLARRLGQVTRLVTIAGNLDPAAWVRLHDYSPLEGSLDPREGGPLPPRIRQLHLAGARDRNVPPALIERAAAGLGAGAVRVVAGADHTCCWQREWPSVLAAGP